MLNFAAFLLSMLAWTPAHGSLKTPEDLILENPVREYKKYAARLRKHGANASFPEFGTVVEKLKAELTTERTRAVIAAHPALGLELAEVKTQLFHVNLDFTFDRADIYPYPRPYPGTYPYRPTIDAIESALRLFDKIDRLSGSNAVPLYHFDRYAYHRHSLLADPEVVIFPTLRPLTFQDLIRVRSVPIGFAGVVTETTRVDRHYQSPLDFWYHDLNHVRRMVAYTALKVRAAGARTSTEKRAVYQAMDDFLVRMVMPNIKPLPKGSSPEDIAVRRLTRVIFFEILHETALAADRDAVLEDLLRPPNTIQPFEHMVPRRAGFERGETERLRTATGNLQSGASVVGVGDDGEATVIRYFHDRALGLLANVYNKINFGFFDDVDLPSAFIAQVEYRKADFVVKAAQQILTALDHPNPPSAADLRSLVLSKDGNPEKFIYKRLQPHELEADQGPQATEPILAEEIVTQVRAIGKTVHTLFGYSKLEYQNPRAVMAQIREELSHLDPLTTVICIGATEEGIGGAYEIAKALGFETIGIVSTQALSYSGKFSPFVDRIFIVNDKLWGGYVPGTRDLSPALRAFIAASDVISAYGGGENTAVTLAEASARGVRVTFRPAEMNHARARRESVERKLPPPTTFTGAAHARATCMNLLTEAG